MLADVKHFRIRLLVLVLGHIHAGPVGNTMQDNAVQKPSTKGGRGTCDTDQRGLTGPVPSWFASAPNKSRLIEGHSRVAIKLTRWMATSTPYGCQPTSQPICGSMILRSRQQYSVVALVDVTRLSEQSDIPFLRFELLHRESSRVWLSGSVILRRLDPDLAHGVPPQRRLSRRICHDTVMSSTREL